MSVLVIDFGSQVTQLIARRVREAGVYCEIVPYNKADAALAKKPRAIILSGGPASVTEMDSPRAPQSVFPDGRSSAGNLLWRNDHVGAVGQQVESGHNREFSQCRYSCQACFAAAGRVGGVRQRTGLDEPWRQDHHHSARLCRGGDIEVSPFAVIARAKRRFYGVRISSRSGPHPARRRAAQFRPWHCQHPARMEHARFPRRRG